jgi:K(+)-stimulated pyrophosphate-energized sodium pump
MLNVLIFLQSALREMMLPGILTIGFPIAIVLLGKLVYADNNQLIAEMLGGYGWSYRFRCALGGIPKCRWCLGQRKKSFEAGVLINGEMTYTRF